VTAPARSKTVVTTLGFLLCGLQVALAAENPAAHVRNFAKVDQYVYRGGDPTAVGLTELGAMGVKVDLDLREKGDATEVERKEAEKLGIKYVNVPMKPFSAPTGDEMERALLLLIENKLGPVFVHCRRGKDRTGTVIACYRIRHDGWSNRDALAEARKHGMSFTERGMQSFILHFKPPLTADVSGAIK
jgi:protein tyrosine/serine phosphatase